MIRCVIWDTDACEVNDNVYESARAGGKYCFDLDVFQQIGSLDEKHKISLSFMIALNNLRGDIFCINAEKIKIAKSASRSSVYDRAFNILDYLIQKTDSLGKYVECEISTLLAISESVNLTEIQYLVKVLTDKDLIDAYSHGLNKIKVEAKGFLQFEENKADALADQAFVAMWFDGSMKSIYDKGIKPAIEAAGYKPMRIDDKEHVNKIDDEIIAEIRRSRFLIADFTSEKDKPRGGVYFEAGFAQGLGIPVIWTCKEDMIADVHFDTRQYNHITWENAEDLRDKLKNRILAVIGEGPNKDL